jgi:N-acetyl-anhydromuramyl-L-alanine amidase AmpD
MVALLFDVFKKLFPNLYLSEVVVDHKGWLQGRNVKRVPIHPSWGYKSLSTADGKPGGLVWHWSATNPGTAQTMAKNRLAAFKPGKDRAASWHVSIETDGTLLQMLPFTAGAWHCRGHNHTKLGIELIGHGKSYTEAQIESARQLCQALVDKYAFRPEDLKHEHRHFEPDRRTDCGPPWTDKHLPEILSKIAWKR